MGSWLFGNFIVTATTAYFKVRKYEKSGNFWYFSDILHPLVNYAAGAGRVIGEIEWVNEQNVIVTIAVDGAIVIDKAPVAFPDLTTSTLYYRFYDDNFYRVAIYRRHREQSIGFLRKRIDFGICI